MKERFQSINFQGTSLWMIRQASDIIEKYKAAGFKLSIRQLYYQFVAADLIENSQQSYDRLGSLMSKARMAGRIDWDMIEDRGRGVETWLIQESQRHAAHNLDMRFGLDYWERQDVYVEVWVEKDALSSVVERACRPFRVPYLACKGYVSSSEAYRAGKRFEAMGDRRKIIIHLGDHDPSGLDMTRDNRERVQMFSRDPHIEVHRIALNMDQVEEHRPPPNFAKMTDSRIGGYLQRYGNKSWELDALEPSIIHELIQDELRMLIDDTLWEETEAEEDRLREPLEQIYERFDDVVAYLKRTTDDDGEEHD